MAHSPTQTQVDQLIYEGTVDPDVEDHLESELDELDKTSKLEELQSESRPKTSRTSIYVRVLEDIINQVFQGEYHLLTPSEWGALGKLGELSYEARYCFAKLILRKEGQWHSVNSMQKFKTEVGVDGLVPALEELCASGNPDDAKPRTQDAVKKEEEPGPSTSTLKPDIQVKQEEIEIIDLTGDDDGADTVPPPSPAKPPPRSNQQTNAVAGPSTLKKEEYTDAQLYDPSDLELDYICQDEGSMSMDELLDRLTVDQLKDLAKVMKARPARTTKSLLIIALISAASSQTVLNFGAVKTSTSKGKAKDDGSHQTQLPFKSPAPKNGKSKDDGLRQAQLPFKSAVMKQSQEKRLRQLALEKLGKCVKINPDYHKLVRRLHIIYYRCTDHPTSLLLPSLLTLFKKRNYPAYPHLRDGTIWQTRAEYMEYESALELEGQIDELDRYVANGSVGRNTPSLAPPRQLMTPVTPGPRQRTTTPHSASKNGNCDTEVPEPDSIPIQRAKQIRRIFDEQVYDRWRELVDIQREEGIRQRTPGLERFECGYVYTRMVNKALTSLARLKEYLLEANVLEELLGQRFWRRGRRGKWYERRAILQMQHLPKLDLSVKKGRDNPALKIALAGLKEALMDEDTGLVSRPGLVKRLVKLEKQINIPEPERTQCEGALREPTKVQVAATRIWDNLKLDGNGRPINKDGESLFNYFGRRDQNEVAGFPQSKSDSKTSWEGQRWKGKSVWLGLDGEQVTVETRALHYYEALGFKGFHSETRILTTLFALLFWDILFTAVPGAFETPYQTAPLDLAEDCFYLARKVLIDDRLEQIRAGHAREILERHDAEYRPKQSWCVGVRWDLCEREDLVDIVESIGGSALAIICRLFCEDYGGRNSGVPDLIVWNAEKKICKFVEVKGPGDTAQENQKLWFDSLLGAGTDVELCQVYDQDGPPPAPKKRARGDTKTPVKRETKPVVAAEDEDEDAEERLDQLPDDDEWLPQAKRQHLGQSSKSLHDGGGEVGDDVLGSALKRKSKRPIDAVYTEDTNATPVRQQSSSSAAAAAVGRHDLNSSPATPPVSPTKNKRAVSIPRWTPIANGDGVSDAVQLQPAAPGPKKKRRKVAPAPVSP